MALIWVTLSMVVLLGIVGLALDTGYCVLTAGQLQNAADAAALAGARIVAVSPTGCKTAAVDIALRNTAAGAPVQVDPAADITVGHWDTSSRAFVAGRPTPSAYGLAGCRASAQDRCRCSSGACSA